MLFHYRNIESFAFSCRECGDKVCICSSKGKWAAHCMTCDNTIGHRGCYDPCASSKYEACRLWNELNGGEKMINKECKRCAVYILSCDGCEYNQEAGKCSDEEMSGRFSKCEEKEREEKEALAAKIKASIAEMEEQQLKALIGYKKWLANAQTRAYTIDSKEKKMIFVEVTEIGTGVLSINLVKIRWISPRFQGHNGCVIKFDNSEKPMIVEESYETMKRKLQAQ